MGVKEGAEVAGTAVAGTAVAVGLPGVSVSVGFMVGTAVDVGVNVTVGVDVDVDTGRAVGVGGTAMLRWICFSAKRPFSVLCK